MRWLHKRWAASWGRSSKGPDVAEIGGNRLAYDELIKAAGGEDTALDARLRQSAERIGRQHDEPDED